MRAILLLRRRPQLIRIGLLLLIGGLLLLPSRSHAAASTLADLPLPAQAVIAATLGKDQPAYHATSHGATVHVTNPRHGLTATLTRTGLTLAQGQITGALQLTGYGYGTPSQPVRHATPRAEHNRVEYRHGPLTEWYVNSPLGLEQGLTLRTPPQGRRTGPLTLALRLSGGLTPRLDASKTAATFLTRTGTPALHYTGLTVTDATGATLPAWLSTNGSRLLIQVDDTRARYPLTIDPFIQQAKLTASDGAAYEFGISVAISGDGHTVVVGASYTSIGSHFQQGAAYVFTGAGSAWTQQAQLTAFDGAAYDWFGLSVAISGDTVVVGTEAAIGGHAYQGSAYVFVKPSTGWATTNTFAAKLTASDGAGWDYFGRSVAISSDTVFVGSYANATGHAYQGAAYVFVKPSTGWATTNTFAAKLTASDGA
ncbi:MAG: FG-GAP repeat protein, partial [candidate division NC10 bacterium]|nr:FG-GAP repeat protein [candidate division NC10 bacterium]